jgi:uncharacterized protein
MKCPVCANSDLLMTERNGIEIDYCPQCRGVWLDRGELDKLIERSAVGIGMTPTTQPHYPHSGYERKHEQHSSHHDGYREGIRHKKSWLSEIFD